MSGTRSPCVAAQTLTDTCFRMDLHEDADKNLMTATFEIPGLSKDKVNIDIRNGKLTVSGEVFESAEKSEGGYSIRERRVGRFSRSVKLPEGTNVSLMFTLLSKRTTN